MGARTSLGTLEKFTEHFFRKKLGIRLLTALQTIHLLEADFNTTTKLIFAQRAMDHAASSDQIPESQYAKKRSRPIEAVLLKRLYYNYI